jgi:hypothetical protein
MPAAVCEGESGGGRFLAGAQARTGREAGQAPDHLGDRPGPQHDLGHARRPGAPRPPGGHRARPAPRAQGARPAGARAPLRLGRELLAVRAGAGPAIPVALVGRARRRAAGARRPCTRPWCSALRCRRGRSRQQVQSGGGGCAAVGALPVPVVPRTVRARPGPGTRPWQRPRGDPEAAVRVDNHHLRPVHSGISLQTRPNGLSHGKRQQRRASVRSRGARACAARPADAPQASRTVAASKGGPASFSCCAVLAELARAIAIKSHETGLSSEHGGAAWQQAPLAAGAAPGGREGHRGAPPAQRQASPPARCSRAPRQTAAPPRSMPPAHRRCRPPRSPPTAQTRPAARR